MFGLRTSPTLITLSLCLVLLAWLSPAAYADPIFSFSDSPSPSPITNGNSTITLTGLSGSGQDAGGAGGVNGQILDINLSSTTSSPSSDSFGTPFNFPLTITDTGSLTSNIVNFTGTLSGSLNSTTSSIMVSNVTPLTPTTFNLGGFTYVVTLQSTNAFLTLGDNFVTVNVQAAPVNSSVPEPNSLALWGIVGIFGLGLGYRNVRGKVAV